MYEFTVENPNGNSFPIDMLRYDSCWPKSEIDASLISDTFEYVTSSHRRTRVTLCTDSRAAPTKGRWSSFRWVVL